MPRKKKIVPLPSISTVTPTPNTIVEVHIGKHAFMNLDRIVASARLDMLRPMVDFVADCAIASIQTQFRLVELEALPREARQQVYVHPVAGGVPVPISAGKLAELEAVCIPLNVPAGVVLDAFVGARLRGLREMVPTRASAGDISLFQSLRGHCDAALAASTKAA